MTRREMILTLDRGNTRVKAAIFCGTIAVASFVMPELTIENLRPIFETFSIKGVIACFTARQDEELMEAVKKYVSGSVMVLTSQLSLPYKNTYKTPETLGADRKALVAGVVATGKFPAAVIDCGTAITLDVVDEGGLFRGGNISPGLSLRFKALHEYTDRLPLVKLAGDAPAVGYDTQTALRAGVVGGVIDEITGFYERVKKMYGCRYVFLTGGDSEFVYKCIGNKEYFILDRELVGKGLVAIYNHNTNEKN